MFSVSISLKFGYSKYQYVSKRCFKFHIEIMNNKRVTAYQTKIPLDPKIAINSSIGDMPGDKSG